MTASKSDTIGEALIMLTVRPRAGVAEVAETETTLFYAKAHLLALGVAHTPRIGQVY